jgi:succinate dehydrogenase/fumarate reductase flavoprotein subunit
VDETLEKISLDTDVVVVGYGGAGASSAITAHDKGVNVMIVEKNPAGGGNTRLAGGGVVKPVNMRAINHIETLCFGKTDKEIIRTYVEEAMKIDDWIEKMGGKTEFYTLMEILYPFPMSPCWPHVPDADAIENRKVTGGDLKNDRPADSLWKLLSSNVEKRGIKVLYNTTAEELLTGPDGEITGIKARSNGKELVINAKKAVILTCGGFEYNDAMKDAYLPLAPIYPFGNPGNTGDGIIMAQRVGAALHHMYKFEGYLAFKAKEYESAFQIRFHGPRFIYVNKDGRRFTDETGWEAHEGWKALEVFKPSRLVYPHLPAYAIFDEVTRKRGRLAAIKTGKVWDYYEWSADNSKEIAKGWVIKGKNIRDLAKQIGMDETNLENTIRKYNEGCNTGRDLEFDRSKETMEAIEVAPFYALELWPGIINTQGGPRRDKEARILSTLGKPISRLYSAGELGSLWGFLYPGGNVMEAIVFGWIAGRNAASEVSRS